MPVKAVFCSGRCLAALVLSLLAGLLAACQLAAEPPVATAGASAQAEILPTTLTPLPTSTARPTRTPRATQTAARRQTATPTPLPPQAVTILPFASDTPTITATAVFSPPDGANPLTGLPPSDPANLERRPVLIKVSNYPPSGRPHSGLTLADMVFEYYIGEGLNRFLALYYGQDASSVGPVRSGRLIDIQLTDMYGGLLVYGNADERVDNVIEELLGPRSIAAKVAPCPPVCGTDTHSISGVFASSAEVGPLAVQRGADNSRQNLAGMVFDDQPPQNGRAADLLGVQFSAMCRGEWRYNAETQQYMRWIEKNLDARNMVALTDRLNGSPVAFSNVVLLFATYVIYSPTLHDVEIWNNTGGQRAYFFRDGQMIEGQWKTVRDTQPIHFFTMDGRPMALKPGNTWIIFAGMRSGFEQTVQGGWEMQFDLP